VTWYRKTGYSSMLERGRRPRLPEGHSSNILDLGMMGLHNLKRRLFEEEVCLEAARGSQQKAASDSESRTGNRAWGDRLSGYLPQVRRHYWAIECKGL
jgi:hypothetical protein